MSCPLTSIVNPINPDQVYLFYLTGGGKYSTGLEIHNYASGTDVVTGFQDNGIPAPTAGTNTIINPGAYSSLLWNSMLNVYGMVRDPTFTPAEGAKSTVSDPKRLAQLSPVYRLIGKTEVNSARGIGLSTIVDGNQQAWMYAFTGESPSTPMKIKVIKLGWGQSSNPTVITPSVAPLANSQLTSVYHKSQDKNFVIYQTKKSLRVADIGGNDIDLPNTTDAREGTGLAAVAYETSAGTRINLYYFAENVGTLQRCVRNEKGKWLSSDAVDEGENPAESAETSYLSATLLKDRVVLFYTLKNQDTIFHQDDKLKSEE